MYRRLGAIAVLGLAILAVFLVFGLDVRNLDDLWDAIRDLWSLIKEMLGGGSISVPSPPRINVPTPQLPG